MICIKFNNQTRLIEKLGENLLGQHPSCWDVVLPPGFGEEQFAIQLEGFLRDNDRHPRVAVQGADHSNSTISDFVNGLHWQWGETKERPKVLDRSPSRYLDIVIKALQVNDRPAILVLKRFHKILDYLEKWVLGKLRTEEQNKRLHTVIITPLPLADLKQRWEARNHYFSTSDYGDSRHIPLFVKPPDPEEVDWICLTFEIPPNVTNYARQLTGGYPEHLAALLEWWLNQERPPLNPRVRAEMLKFACKQLNGFLEWLDPLENGRYRDRVIDLYHNFDSDQALEAFHNHPWRDVVLEDNGLRAEALGEAALNAALNVGSNEKASQSPWYEASGQARRLYERKQYKAALGVLNAMNPIRLRPHDKVLQAHARIMVELAGDEGDEHFGGDTNCHHLRGILEEARTHLSNGKLGLSANDRIKIEGRLGQLEEVASAVKAASQIKGRFQNRLGDILAGFAGLELRNARGAALLLFAKIKAGKAIAGDGSACHFVLALPEQIFRTWALWALDLNYYNAPLEDEKTWQIVEENWPRQNIVIHRPKPREEFPNFRVFTFYALACLRAIQFEGTVPAPEAEFKELERSLSAYESIRTGNAHGLYQPTRRQRQGYFDLIERWFRSLLASGFEGLTQEHLIDLTEPLPVLNSDGTVCW